MFTVTADWSGTTRKRPSEGHLPLTWPPVVCGRSAASQASVTHNGTFCDLPSSPLIITFLPDRLFLQLGFPRRALSLSALSSIRFYRHPPLLCFLLFCPHPTRLPPPPNPRPNHHPPPPSDERCCAHASVILSLPAAAFFAISEGQARPTLI